MAQYLFIVSRGNPDLYTYLREHHSGDRKTVVILDRRDDDPTATPATKRLPYEDRRSRPEVDQRLKSRPHVVVTIP